jgi:hypothetical protein
MSDSDNEEKKWYQIWWVWLIILVVIGWIFGEDTCGCSDDDIVQMQRSMGMSREAVIKWCCELEEMLD